MCKENIYHRDTDPAPGRRSFGISWNERDGRVQNAGKLLLSPPGFLFPIVWTVLYVLMGIGSALIYCSEDPRKEHALKTYAAQLAANFLWTIFFFTFKWRLFAFFWIILLIALVISMIRQFAAIRPLAGKLQLPYLYWLLFAAYLNLGVWYLNR